MSSFFISILVHILLFSIQWEFTNLEDKKKENKQITRINITLKSLKNKDIIDLEKYNNKIVKEAKFISNENNSSKEDIKEVESEIESLTKSMITQESIKLFKEKDLEKTKKEKYKKNKANTVKFDYFDYYKKIKLLVDSKWNKKLKENDIDDFAENNETFILLKINSSGEILSKKIDKSSGIFSVDYAALRTFDNIRLPPPPKQLLRDKLFFFIQWGFSMKVETN